MAELDLPPLDAHRQAWLDAHPDRDEEWLRQMAREGFDVHHLDGDHGNNDPDNLVLIEHLDHMMLHLMKMNRLRPVKGAAGPHGRWLDVKGGRVRLFYRERKTKALRDWDKGMLDMTGRQTIPNDLSFPAARWPAPKDANWHLSPEEMGSYVDGT